MTARARLGAFAAFVLAAAAVAVAALFATSGGDGPPGPLRAAIIDQASLTQANPELIWKAVDQLERAGYGEVDYFPGEQITVDFYRTLPDRDYDLVLLRTHSGLIRGGASENEAFIFTSEPYDSSKYLDDQRARRLIVATYADIDEGSVALRDIPRLFGLSAEFIRSGMQGRFDDTLVILMGCNGLTSNTLAKAFVEKGAREVMSWDGLVSATHTDAATERLLLHLFEAGLPTEEAVAQTMAEVGPDPTYNSVLRAYPSGG